MRFFLVIPIFFAINLNAQTTLDFNKRYVESEDKWVAFKPGKDSAYAFGFIYIDEHAGLTLNYEGTFKIMPTGEFVSKKLDSTNMKVRLQPNNVLVAFIPETKFKELRITAIPEWLKYYKTDTNSVASLYRRGYVYNGLGECAKALLYLERAERTDPKFKGLAVELSFSYNCLKEYGKAEAILEEAIKTTDAYVNKEYIYTLTKINKIDKATKQFEKSIKNLSDNQYNAENCYNILQHFFYQKDKGNFNKWYNELSKHPISNKLIRQYADNMKSELDK